MNSPLWYSLFFNKGNSFRDILTFTGERDRTKTNSPGKRKIFWGQILFVTVGHIDKGSKKVTVRLASHGKCPYTLQED